MDLRKCDPVGAVAVIRMELMRSSAVIVFFAILLGSASAASAAAITCPNPQLQYPQNNGKVKLSNTYTVTPAIDCVWGPDNLGNGHDEFIAGVGTNDAAYGNTGATFGLSWTLIGSTGGVSSSDLTKISGLTFSGVTSKFGNWSIDPTVASLSNYNTFALGVKDGSDPKWAVFLLDSSQLSGTVSMWGGSFSHFTLYGANVPSLTTVPEPGSLLLLGSGLVVLARRARRKLCGS